MDKYTFAIWRILLPLALVAMLVLLVLENDFGRHFILALAGALISWSLDFAVRWLGRNRLAESISRYKQILQGIGRDEANSNLTSTALIAFIKYKTRQRQLATAILLLALVLYSAVSWLLKIEPSTLVTAALVGALVILQAGSIALEYRIRHALYGTVEYEARQIVRFILNNADEVDMSGGLGSVAVSMEKVPENVLQANWGIVR